jgi:hypothetical protein
MIGISKMRSQSQVTSWSISLMIVLELFAMTRNVILCVPTFASSGRVFMGVYASTGE